MNKKGWVRGHSGRFLGAFVFFASLLIIPVHYKDRLVAYYMHFKKPVANLTGHVEELVDWDEQQKNLNFQAKISQDRASQYLKTHEKERYDTLHLELLETHLGQAIQARVVFQPAFTDSSVLWVRLPQSVEIGSAVVVGNNLLGVVDFVAFNAARVRLINDPNFVVSVRVLRAQSPVNFLYQDIKLWLETMNTLSTQGQEAELATCLKKALDLIQANNLHLQPLAKGILRGHRELFKGKHPLLEGQGFNYTWPDAFSSSLDHKIALVKPGDELVTSGLDGLFPQGLRVARVVSAQAKDPAESLYDLKAVPILHTLESIQSVWILPLLMTIKFK